MRRILISGVCGFVGSAIARHLVESSSSGTIQVVGFDNLSRHGSWTNVKPLRDRGVSLIHADVRNPVDLENIAACDWIIDAAANPSVLAGVDGKMSSRGLVDTNLLGTINLLELCKKWRAGLVLLSTSRVYSLAALGTIPLIQSHDAFVLDIESALPFGVTQNGITESFSTQSPVSLYGATKIASEQFAIEYAAAFDFPIWINRCGVLAGAGQFARPDQGIFAYWLHSWHRGKPLKYIGFGGMGRQVRDCLHPVDLARLIGRQIDAPASQSVPRIVNVSGGMRSARSLLQLSQWCECRWGPRSVSAVDESRPFDVPWMVLDATTATRHWNWLPKISVESILEEIAQFSDANPDWLAVSN